MNGIAGEGEGRAAATSDPACSGRSGKKKTCPDCERSFSSAHERVNLNQIVRNFD
jgi:hypothetical protein